MVAVILVRTVADVVNDIVVGNPVVVTAVFAEDDVIEVVIVVVDVIGTVVEEAVKVVVG
jgi:hypothetical protein